MDYSKYTAKPVVSKAQANELFNEVSMGIKSSKAKHPLYDHGNPHYTAPIIEAMNSSTTKAEFKKKVMYAIKLTSKGFNECQCCQWVINNRF